MVYVVEETSSSAENLGHTVIQEYTVTLFHQLKCLDIIRRELTESTGGEPTPLATHCMNYLRQTILCAVDMRLESVKHPLGAVERVYDTTCKDWETVYTEAERNHRAYRERMRRGYHRGNMS